MKRSLLSLVFGLAAAAILLAWTVSCGHSRGANPAATPRSRVSVVRHEVNLQSVLRDIDAYPVPKGVSAETWTMLVTELKKQLVARSKDGKTLSIEPTGTLCKVTDLAAVSDAGGTQATVTWTEALAGDCNNDGEVSIADLQPIAAHYGETSSGPGSAAYLADANGDGEVGITDLQPIAADYSMHVEGYQVWRGAFNGTSTDWETTFRPNTNPANPSWSADRTASPPATSRPAYTYLDDISGLTDKTNVRYKVGGFGDGAEGQESDEAIMPPPTPTGHSVSGTVTEGGVGLAGLMMTLTPGGLHAATQAGGTYTIVNVPDGDYTLTPDPYGHIYTPATRSITVSGADVTGQDFTATTVSNVTGTVTEGGVGLAGVTMTLAPGGLSAVTSGDGSYMISGVADGSYTLTPTLSGYTFTPPTRSVNVAGADVSGQDFAATPTPPTYNVSGTVTRSASGVAGVTMTLTPGGLSAPTQADGTYTIPGVADGDYNLTPAKVGYSFSPPFQLVHVSGADVPGQDFAAYAGPAQTAWPKFHGDSKNTGQSSNLGPAVENLKWSVAVGTGLDSTPVIGLDGSIYVTCYDGNVYALDPLNGGTKWQHAVGSDIQRTPAVGADGTVYVDGADGNAYALSPADGSIVWAHAIGSLSNFGGVAVGPDGTIYAGSDDQNLYALNPADGSVNWQRATGGQVLGCPAIADDGTIYVASNDGVVHAVNPSDGSVKWDHPLGTFTTSSPAVAADGTVYIGCDDAKVYALNPSDGSEKWAYLTTGMIQTSPAVATDGTIYVGNQSSALYALNPTDGTVKWGLLFGSAFSSSAAIGSDGAVYIGCNDSSFYALTASLTTKWSYAGAGMFVSSPAISASGEVFVGCNDGNVYCFSP